MNVLRMLVLALGGVVAPLGIASLDVFSYV